MDRARARSLTLNAIGLFFGLAALYHLVVIARPSLDNGGATLRHAMFVLIDALVALGLFVRPRFFFWVFTALALQQLHSHGSALIREWTFTHSIDWLSVLVLGVIPLTWAFLYFEYRSRARRHP